jgi:GNAT superfamily N-acetyltransferase
MQKVDTQKYDKDLTGLFKDFKENYIPDAILEGEMGQVLVDDIDDPQTAVLAIPDFKVYFFGGDAKNKLVQEQIKELPIFATVMFGSEGWPEQLKAIHPEKWIVMPRFAFSSDSLDIKHLKELKDQLLDEYRIEKIDLALAERIRGEKTEVTAEQLFGFDSAEDFLDRGLGYCIFFGEEIVSVGAAGAACKKGIEIQINTSKKHRGKGLATAVGAALIIDCLEQGIDPNWDAATEISAGLAKKLGYAPKGEYLVYVFAKYKFLVGLRNFLRRIRGKDIIEP